MRPYPHKVTHVMLAFLLTGCFVTSSSLPSSSVSLSSTTTSTEVVSTSTTTSSVSSVVTSSEIVVTTITITFIENGGSEVGDLTLTPGEPFTEPTPPTREGYVFIGWFTDSSLTQAYEFTIVPNQNLTLYAKWISVTEYGAISIAAFKALALATYAEVVGIVVFASVDMELVVIADEEQTLAIMSNTPLVQGDLVRMGGVRQDFNGHPVMMNALEQPENIFLTKYGGDQPIPLAPTSHSLLEFTQMDVTDPNQWIQYIQLSGTFVIGDQFIGLQSGELLMPIYAPTINETNIKSYMMYVGLEVTMDGISLPLMDEEPPQLIFVFIGGESHLQFNYTDEGLLAAMLGFLKAYLESTTYYPGQAIDLPDQHPTLPMPVTYEAFGDDDSLINLETATIVDTIVEPTTIHLIATGQYKTYTNTVDIFLEVMPITPLSIAEFKLLEDDVETFYFLEGVVVFLMLEHQVAMLADATGIVYVFTNEMLLAVGDHILVRGVKMTTEDQMILLANEPSETVVKIISHDQAMPLLATPISIADFAALDAINPANSWQYFTVEGTLMYDEIHALFYLTNGTINIPIMAVDADAANALMAMVNLSVAVSGLSLRPGEETFLILMFLNLPNDLNLLST